MLNPTGQKRKDVIEEREKWTQNQGRIDCRSTYFLDEMGINCGMTPLYGRALSGERIYEYVPDVRFERTSVISALGLNGIIAPLAYKGTLNGDLFREYIKTQLAPIMQKGDTLVLDNLSVHTMKNILKPLTEKGIIIKFLPKYSPDFNPIELAWSKMKTIIKKSKARLFDNLINAVSIALDSLTESDVLGWFHHCGYGL
jgi:transposase